MNTFLIELKESIVEESEKEKRSDDKAHVETLDIADDEEERKRRDRGRTRL